MKLYDPKLEMTVIKSICESDRKIKNKLLAQVTPEHFHHDPTKEAIGRIFALLRSSGDIPSFAEVCSDPVLSETNRKLLRKSDTDLIKDESKLRKAVRVLHKYYQVRNLYFLSEGINKELQQEKIDVDKLLESTADKLSRVRTRSDHTTQIFHFGKGNNSSTIIKKLLDGVKPSLVPTGFKEFDEKNGGIAYGSLFVLGGSTGGGKCQTYHTLIPFKEAVEVDTFVVKLEDGSTRTYWAHEPVKLTSGQYKQAKDLREEDDIEM